MEDLDTLCPVLPSGPLSRFRSNASFDWKKLRILTHGEDMLRLKMKVWRAMELDPVFSQHLHINSLGKVSSKLQDIHPSMMSTHR